MPGGKLQQLQSLAHLAPLCWGITKLVIHGILIGGLTTKNKLLYKGSNRILVIQDVT